MAYKTLSIRATPPTRQLRATGTLGSGSHVAVWARENTCWEAISLAAGIDPAHLLGAALLAGREHTMRVGELFAVSHSLEVVKKRFEFAKLPGGWRDRDFLDKLVGFL